MCHAMSSRHCRLEDRRKQEPITRLQSPCTHVSINIVFCSCFRFIFFFCAQFLLQGKYFITFICVILRWCIYIISNLTLQSYTQQHMLLLFPLLTDNMFDIIVFYTLNFSDITSNFSHPYHVCNYWLKRIFHIYSVDVSTTYPHTKSNFSSSNI
jgi:hypothetical protein